MVYLVVPIRQFRSVGEGVDAFNRGDVSTATAWFEEVTKSLGEAGNFIFETGGAIPGRLKWAQRYQRLSASTPIPAHAQAHDHDQGLQ